MKHGVTVGLVGIGLVLTTSGCSGISAGMSGEDAARNAARTSSFLRVSLDGHEAERDNIEQAVRGRSEWKIEDWVSTRPTLRFRVTDLSRLGRVTQTTISIFQEFHGQFAGQPEFILVPRYNSPDNLLRPNENYDLGNPPWSLRIIDVHGREVEGVRLVPGTKYQLQFTVRGDQNETASVVFETY